MAWPWEALHDPPRGFLALQCHLERKLNTPSDPLPQPDLTKDRVNVLLVVARPFQNDVSYGSIARPLVDLIGSQRLPRCIGAFSGGFQATRSCCGPGASF